jgi:hypothetical protein
MQFVIGTHPDAYHADINFFFSLPKIPWGESAENA